MLCKRFSHAPSPPSRVPQPQTAPMATINFCLQNFRLRWTHASLLCHFGRPIRLFVIFKMKWTSWPVSDRAIKLIKISGYRVTSTHRWDAKVPCVFFPYFIIAKYMDNLKALLLLMYVCMCLLRLLLLFGMRNAKLIWRQTLKEHNLRDWIWI